MAWKKRKAWKGIAEAKRKLRLLPLAVKTELIDALDASGRDILKEMEPRTPFRTGKLRSGLSYAVTPRTASAATTSMRVKVGLLKTKAGRSDLFYGRILDIGFGKKFPLISRWHAKAKRRTKVFTLHMPGLTGRRFVTGRYADARQALRTNVQGVYARAIAKMPKGFDD